MSDRSTSTSRSGGISVLTLLGVAFIILKLCGVITWSWWLVTLPLWGGAALLLALALLAVLIGGGIAVAKRSRR